MTTETCIYLQGGMSLDEYLAICKLAHDQRPVDLVWAGQQARGYPRVRVYSHETHAGTRAEIKAYFGTGAAVEFLPLPEVKPPPPVEPVDLDEPYRFYRTVTATRLNVRDSPNGKILGQLLKGDRVEVLSDDKWMKVVYKDNFAYIWRDLTKAEAEPVAEPFLLWPVDNPNHRINFPFGEPRDYDGDGVKDDLHEGADMTARKGDKIFASLGGTVVRAGNKTSRGVPSDYGNHVIVDSGEWACWYCHLSRLDVKVGDVVERGDVLGLAGSTGNSTAAHLHFNVVHKGHGAPGVYVVRDVVDPAGLLGLE